MCKNFSPSPGLLLVLFAGLAMVACDSYPSLVAPSSVPSFPSPHSSSSGATVEGRVNADRQSAGSRTAAHHCADLTVEVVGTTRSTLVGCDGRFALTNVPEGEVILRFVGLEEILLGEVRNGETIEVEVSIIGNDVALVSVAVTNEDDDAEDSDSDDDDAEDS